jgi:outer membrane protein assembly factor BamB
MIDDSLYAAGGDFLTSIDPSTGKNRWKFKVDGLCHQPLLFHGVLYVSTSSGFVYTLDPASGRQISSSKLKNGGYSVDGLQKIDDGTIGAILFGYPKPCCYIGLDAGTGKEKWEVQPVVQESDWPVFASSNLACFANHESLDVRELPSGNKKWHVDVGGLLGLFAPPTVIGGTVYYSEGNTFHAVDLSSGQSKWTYGIGGGCNVAVSNGVVIVAAAKHVYALDEATGHLKWKGNINTPGKYAPCIADGLIFVGGDDGYIYALDFSTGAPSWSYTSHEYTVPAQHWAD